MVKTTFLLLTLIASSAALSSQDQTPEFVSTLLMSRIRAGCNQTEANFRPPSPGEPQWVYVLNGKQFTQREWIEFARRAQVSKCSTDNIEVDFPGAFPSTAVVIYRVQHSETVGGKIRIFSVYAKHTFEYVNSQWILRKMEAVSAK